MFFKSKYTISFYKNPILYEGKRKIVKDIKILQVLSFINSKCNFKTIKIELSDKYTNYIVIKCKNKEKDFIFNKFCQLLDDYIAEVKCYRSW